MDCCEWIVLGSVWLGFWLSWYYIHILFNQVDAGKVFAFIATYSLWIVFVVTIVLALSAWLPTGGAAGLAIFITLIFQILDSLIGKYWTMSPWKIPICIVLVPENAEMSDLWKCGNNGYSNYRTYPIWDLHV